MGQTEWLSWRYISLSGVSCFSPLSGLHWKQPSYVSVLRYEPPPPHRVANATQRWILRAVERMNLLQLTRFVSLSLWIVAFNVLNSSLRECIDNWKYTDEWSVDMFHVSIYIISTRITRNLWLCWLCIMTRNLYRLVNLSLKKENPNVYKNPTENPRIR